jgi:hypothetical protein
MLVSDEPCLEMLQKFHLKPVVSLAACSAADTTSRGIVNFGQTLVWYSSYLLATSKQRRASTRQLLEQLEAQQWQ